MQQFTFEAVSRRNGATERIRATARHETIARAHVLNYYGRNFDVCERACDVRPAHYFVGEIDCSSPDAEQFALDYIAKHGA